MSKLPRHCEERSDVAISWYIVRICAISQEIATAFGLAMTVVVGRWCGFTGVRWSFPCVLRNAGDGVPYGQKCRATPPGVAGPHLNQKNRVRFSMSLRGRRPWQSPGTRFKFLQCRRRLPEGELPRRGKRSHPGVRRATPSSQ